ncbi:uncharacterized protein TrAFT101_003894 [Trichoderma asperellum]|uniref:Mid2 domain-containing protein n=1 Tax=Trichoderma asperellum (strain ATCC 204424 / CBS 433.97 / NBRC 101777) TaxID=1042311 RepID=A0A2T3ZPB8_TRIA4|nr:hypothetical protein M441DRAFT_182274 [Trichoderma asperellum CBS 433.97]PTB46660.1 hypothetical protein M441DRAFT_182274 [Trichoderma asperellum CBS 433.97]UKZ88130.1 hypothetical protein TrAFT101_003894 [Trichoderma asperellum]
MRHGPAATLLLALGAVVSTVTADNNNQPVPKSGFQQSWASPAKETVTSGHEVEQQVALGWSPKPTQPPKPLLGRMMMPRADGYTLGPETCGFVPGNDGNSFTCVSSGYTCTPQGGFVGCCQPNSSCSQIKTTCIDYQASATGACNLPSDFHTLCCATSTLPACYTWVISTSASTDKSVELYTILGCSLQPGRGTLLTVDPGWLATHSFGSTTTTTTATTTSTEPSSTSPTSTPDSGGGKSSTPVGAIAGGTVGGVAALGLVGLTAFLFYRHRNGRNNAPPAGHPPQGQNDAAAGGAVYPSGVPVGYQAGYAPVPMQQGYYPQQFQGQYPPQQQYNYNYPVQTASTSPVHTTPSPGVFKEGETSASELPTTSPLGAETNRAELGGGN